jgi:import inner membrane translocase subunit TIM44
MKYDESDNIMVRLSRNVTDKVGDAFSGVLTQSDMSETLAEIRKLDPNFDKETFIRECRYEIIPTVLEAFLQGKDDILKDWCHEAVRITISTHSLTAIINNLVCISLLYPLPNQSWLNGV